MSFIKNGNILLKNKNFRNFAMMASSFGKEPSSEWTAKTRLTASMKNCAFSSFRCSFSWIYQKMTELIGKKTFTGINMNKQLIRLTLYRNLECKWVFWNHINFISKFLPLLLLSVKTLKGHFHQFSVWTSHLLFWKVKKIFSRLDTI